MKASLLKVIGFAAVVTLNATAVNAQERTQEGMWMSEYTNTVEQGLYALNSKNYQKAFEKLLQASKWGNKDAQFYLSQMYLNGWGMDPDYKQGWLWFKVALEQSRLTGKTSNAMKSLIRIY